MEKDKSLVNNAMKYGLILGIVLVIYSYLTRNSAFSEGGMSTSFIMFGATVLVYVLGIVISTNHFRKSKLDNVMTYGQSFSFGVLVVLFASFITAVYTYVFTTWIEPDYLQEVYVAGKENLLDMYDRMNVPEETIELALDKIESEGAGTPSSAAINGLWVNLLFGGFVSLITSIFTQKKNKNPFSTISDEDDSE